MTVEEECPSSPTLLGEAFVLPLVVVQVRPLLPTSSDALCSAFVKNLLLNIPIRSLRVHWDLLSSGQLASGYLSIPPFSSKTAADNGEDVPIICLPSSDPSVTETIPCHIKGFSKQRISQFNSASVTRSTLVQILPSLSDDQDHLTFLDVVAGNLEAPTDQQLQQEVLRNHNEETIKSLQLYFKQMLAQSIQIGTTADALSNANRRNRRILGLQRATRRHKRREERGETHQSTSQSSTNHQIHNTTWQPSLLFHSADHAAGKTLLVQAIAKQLECQTHTISAGQLLAQYGTRADTALESQLHQWVIQAGLSNRPVCIILDHLDTFLPPRLSNRSSAGDAALPILHAMASYLKTLVSSLKHHHSFPFPRSNPLYNAAGANGGALSVKLCLVGVLTCPNDGWAKMGSESILNALGGARLKLPLLTTKTRLRALLGALEDAGLTMEKSSNHETRLHTLADSMTWARGISFSRIAKLVKQKVGSSCSATLLDLQKAVGQVGGGNSLRKAVSQEAILETNQTVHFESVGGCVKAKESLEDALALDPNKRRLLARFGMKPPTGVLLYGPPGCGKTLLAKAVASLIQKQSSSTSTIRSGSNGGSFVSLKSSEIVQASVGTSEKLVKTAFEVARERAPSVVFIDEFQALFTQRSSGGSSKLASTLLQAMDDIQRWSAADDAVRDEGVRERVVVLGATNTPWMVDKAFLRPGRFDQVVYIDLPNIEERISILNVHVSGMRLAQDVDFEGLKIKVSEKTEGFSGADLAALCRAAAMRCLLECGEGGSITEDHFLDSIFNDVMPSSSKELLDQLASWKM